jgi:hypothetical protein
LVEKSEVLFPDGNKNFVIGIVNCVVLAAFYAFEVIFRKGKDLFERALAVESDPF